MTTLAAAAVAVLATAAPAEKVRLTHEAAAAWASGAIAEVGACAPPERPARPERPPLLPPNRMPRRGYAGAEGRIALLHALAHIELNAIDLAWDVIARFTFSDLPRAFYDDWVRVARDEADHFAGLEALMGGLGARYGDLPAHDGLWQAAEKTADDLLARLAVVPMALEARGLDTTPATIDRLRAHGDEATCRQLAVIYEDEIRHVAAGCRWFLFLCRRAGADPATAFHHSVRRHLGRLKAPFNHQARARAGMPAAFYEPLVQG